jgi:hypothetical protein
MVGMRHLVHAGAVRRWQSSALKTCVGGTLGCFFILKGTNDFATCCSSPTERDGNTSCFGKMQSKVVFFVADVAILLED